MINARILRTSRVWMSVSTCIVRYWWSAATWAWRFTRWWRTSIVYNQRIVIVLHLKNTIVTKQKMWWFVFTYLLLVYLLSFWELKLTCWKLLLKMCFIEKKMQLWCGTDIHIINMLTSFMCKFKTKRFCQIDFCFITSMYTV